MTLLFKKPSNS